MQIFNNPEFGGIRTIEENAVICMMSCASIEHLKQAYKDLKKEKE